MHLPPPILNLLVLVVAAGWLGGCDVFTPRAPDEPIGEGGDWIQPVDASYVVQNIVSAVEQLNETTYGRSFAVDFTFRPTPAAQAAYGQFTNWTAEDERTYFSLVARSASQGASHRLTFVDEALSDVGEGRREFTAEYRLEIYHNEVAIPREFRGRLSWVIVYNDDRGLWEIGEWTDQEVDGAPAWSILKGAFLR